MKSYAVVFTYSFDDDAAVFLFDTLEAAKEFMLKSYKEELRIEKEENENLANVSGFVMDDNTYAKIINHSKCDVTEFHIANVYC